MIQVNARNIAVFCMQVPVAEGSTQTREAYRLHLQLTDMNGLPIVSEFWMEITPEQARQAGQSIGNNAAITLAF